MQSCWVYALFLRHHTSVKLAGFSPLTALLHCKLKGPKHSGYIQLLFTVMAATGKSELMFRPRKLSLFVVMRLPGVQSRGRVSVLRAPPTGTKGAPWRQDRTGASAVSLVQEGRPRPGALQTWPCFFQPVQTRLRQVLERGHAGTSSGHFANAWNHDSWEPKL